MYLVSGSSKFGNGLELAGIIFLCILVIAASYFVTKFIGTSQIKRHKNSNFQILEVCGIGPGKTLQLIQVGTKYIVIAVSKESVSKILELTEEEIIQKSSYIEKGTGFSDIFSNLLKKKEGDIPEEK